MKNVLKCAAFVLLAAAASPPCLAQQMVILPPPDVMDDGTITTPSFPLPFSSLASEQARQALVESLRTPMPITMDLAKTRKITDDRMLPLIAEAKQIFPVNSTKTKMGGVPVEVFVPKAGVSPENADRVLIEVHGGAFVAGGGGIGGAIESIPIVGEARIEVISVDYRLAPENAFPAASQDVEAVYREVLKTHNPQNVGIYGCSAGGMLAGQSIAWFLNKGLPLPGAIGVFCASLVGFGSGDSAQLWPHLGSLIRLVRAEPKDVYGAGSPYLAGQSVSNPLVNPGMSKELLAKFPPTLFLTGTRSPDMSGAAESALRLQEAGVEAQLSLFDGMDHGFFTDPNLPESRRAYKIIADWFRTHLGKK